MTIQTTQQLLTFATPTEIIIQNAQDEVIALIQILIDVLPDQGSDDAVSSASPDWDQLHPRMASQLRTELNGIITAVDAAPVA